jgi:hypothetical protein
VHAVIPSAQEPFSYQPRKNSSARCASHSFYELKRIVRTNDPTAFLIVTEAGEIVGEGIKPNCPYDRSHKKRSQFEKLSRTASACFGQNRVSAIVASLFFMLVQRWCYRLCWGAAFLFMWRWLKNQSLLLFGLLLLVLIHLTIVFSPLF